MLPLYLHCSLQRNAALRRPGGDRGSGSAACSTKLTGKYRASTRSLGPAPRCGASFRPRGFPPAAAESATICKRMRPADRAEAPMRGRIQPEKSLRRKDLGPDRQHPDEQRQRRQRGSFLDDGPYHNSFLPLLDRTRTVFYFCSGVKSTELSHCAKYRV